MAVRRSRLALVLGVAPLALFAITAYAEVAERTATTTRPLGEEAQFLANAHQEALGQLKRSELAASKASDPAVAQFASRVSTQRSSLRAAVERVAGIKGIELTDELLAQHRNDVTRLATLSGAAFDNAYMQQALIDHLQAVTMFESAARDSEDAAIRSFAESQLPALREELARARQVAHEPAEATGRAATR